MKLELKRMCGWCKKNEIETPTMNACNDCLTEAENNEREANYSAVCRTGQGFGGGNGAGGGEGF